jgi:hypothetical protein
MIVRKPKDAVVCLVGCRAKDVSCWVYIDVWKHFSRSKIWILECLVMMMMMMFAILDPVQGIIFCKQDEVREGCKVI